MVKKNAFVLTSAVVIFSFSLLFLFSYIYKARAFAELKERRDVVFEMIKNSAKDIAEDFVVIYDDDLEMERINQSAVALSFSLHNPNHYPILSHYISSFLPFYSNISNINLSLSIHPNAMHEVLFNITTQNNTNFYFYEHSGGQDDDELSFTPIAPSLYSPKKYTFNITIYYSRNSSNPIIYPSFSSSGILVNITYKDENGTLNLEGYVNSTTTFFVSYLPEGSLNITFYPNGLDGALYVKRKHIANNSIFKGNIIMDFPEGNSSFACFPIKINITTANVFRKYQDYVVEMPCFFSG
jgi:hypothetical protein